MSPVNPFFGGSNGGGTIKAPVSIGLGGLGVPIAEVRRDGLSRGGSPVSVV